MWGLGQWLLTTPLWGIFAVLAVGLLLSALVGSVLRRRLLQRAQASAKDEKSDQEGYIVSAVMGLLALLVGFTFSMAIDRFDTRRNTVLVEANAIGTTYLRAQMLDEPYRTQMSRLLVDYTDNRIELAKLAPGPRQTELLRKNDGLLTDLWSATVAAFPSMKPYVFSHSFLETMNQMIDMDTTRKTARQAHVPPQVFTLLFVYQFIAAGVLGYVLVGRHGRLTAAFLLLLFALSVIVIIDIDRPTTGSVREAQEPMLLLQASMKAQPPGSYDAPAPARPAAN